MAYTSQDLLESIGRKSFLPTGQSTFTSAELLAIADEQSLNTVVPALMAVKEEFLVFHTDYTITSNQNAYDVPVRAIGMNVRDVAIVNGTVITPDFPRLEPEEIASSATGEPRGFYLKNNQIILYPTPVTGGKVLRVYYFLKPSRLVDTAAGAIISAIDTATNTITVSTIPSTWVTGNTFDLIRKDGSQEPRGVDMVSTTVSGNDIIFASLPSTLTVGDYVALAGETPLVQLPDEFRPILAQAVAAEILENTNQPGADKAAKTLMKLIETAQKLITPRVQGADRVIVNRTWF